MGKGFIRQATPQDIDALMDIYIECFPERVNAVFGGPHRRVFIRDYLLFYLAWDPTSNWVYVKDGRCSGIHHGSLPLFPVEGNAVPCAAIPVDSVIFSWENMAFLYIL